MHLLPFCQGGLGSNPIMGKLRSTATAAPGRPHPYQAMVEDAAAKVPRSERRRLNGVVIYTFWNIWKERNRRIFDNLIETVPQVAVRIKEDIQQRKRALVYV